MRCVGRLAVDGEPGPKLAGESGDLFGLRRSQVPMQGAHGSAIKSGVLHIWKRWFGIEPGL